MIVYLERSSDLFSVFSSDGEEKSKNKTVTTPTVVQLNTKTLFEQHQLAESARKIRHLCATATPMLPRSLRRIYGGKPVLAEPTQSPFIFKGQPGQKRGLRRHRGGGGVPTFFWRFRQNKTTSTSSRMMPMPTMSTGKFDTRVTIRSNVLIWDAESSSIVAV
ncbi:hypothetical protein FQN60_018045 [Etheostoma spectabile]|uniref:Uncharacterized protein n=1 Tax=Etheostoma spectabile TaxID=54343 RepID=A0A5J5DHA3_9PERO|nr:hypothetical protein FQN60_018045 [Etheostoma spectabile]